MVMAAYCTLRGQVSTAPTSLYSSLIQSRPSLWFPFGIESHVFFPGSYDSYEIITPSCRSSGSQPCLNGANEKVGQKRKRERRRRGTKKRRENGREPTRQYSIQDVSQKSATESIQVTRRKQKGDTETRRSPEPKERTL